MVWRASKSPCTTRRFADFVEVELGDVHLRLAQNGRSQFLHAVDGGVFGFFRLVERQVCRLFGFVAGFLAHERSGR
jgi:hypothetical protein